ncbi:MAG TPA: hypothetical protein VIL55_01305 [Naasia sp.]|jgi:hypothetical protein
MRKGEYNDGEEWAPMEDLLTDLTLDPALESAYSTGNARPVRWRDLPAERAAEEWDALRAWVEWVTARFDVPLTLIPTCWWKHPALVEELTALHTAWRAAYADTDTGFGPLMWLERWHTAKARMREAYPASCGNGHKESKRRSWTETTDQDEWNAWVTDAHGD